MHCEEIQLKLNARTDGELSEEEIAAVDVHLVECSQCRLAADTVVAIDADLRRAFSARRQAAAQVAERTLDRLGALPVAPPSSMRGRRARIAWGQVLVGLVLGFLLALVLPASWRRPEGGSTSALPVARLAVASGPVEVKEATQGNFFLCPTDASIAPHSIVRTGSDARCEIALDQGHALGLDRDTEVTLREQGNVEVKRGRVWSTSQPNQRDFQIQSRGTTFVAKGPAQLALACDPPAVSLTVVAGAVNVRTDGDSTDVGPGRHVRIVDGKLREDPNCDPLLETAWVNRVLALRGSEDPELAGRVNRLLANIGAAKLSLLYEDELRRLGDDGVAPLLAYLASTKVMPNGVQRTVAARIAADVARTRWIPDWIELLTDANAEVRYHAARALERLTGRDQGCSAPAWRSQSWDQLAGAFQRWLSWWAENRDYYPAARRDLSVPASEPF